MLHKSILISFICATALVLSSCGGSGSKKQNIENLKNVESTTVEQSNDDILTKLLKNSAKMLRLDPDKGIMEHNGQVYYSTYGEVSKIPGSTILPYYDGFAIIDDAIIYYKCQGIENARCELGQKNLQNGAETLILEDIYICDVWIVGNKVIYAKKHYPEDSKTTGLFWYDLKTSKSTRLHKEMNNVVSFDDDFVYFSENSVGDIWRVRWDGTQEEFLQDVKMPKDLYKVEGDYYYCMEIFRDANYDDWRKATTTISKYAIADGKPVSDYTVYTWGLLDIVDGWAFFTKNEGLFKINTTNGTMVLLANLTSFENMSFKDLIGVTRDNIYFEVMVNEEHDCFERRYKVPFDGGAMVLVEEYHCYFD